MIEYLWMALDFANGVGVVYEAVEFLQPTIEQLPGGIDLPEWAAPSLALGAVLSMVALSGVAVGSLAVMLTALLLLALILDQIFGVTIELRL